MAPVPIQNARYALAMRVAVGVVEVYGRGFTTSDEFHGRMMDVIQALARCTGYTTNLTRASQLAVDRTLSKLEGYCHLYRIRDNRKRAGRWAALMWVALTLLEDVQYTCPEYRDIPYWAELLTLFTQVTDMLRVQFPEMDVEGTALYEAVR